MTPERIAQERQNFQAWFETQPEIPGTEEFIATIEIYDVAKAIEFACELQLPFVFGD